MKQLLMRALCGFFMLSLLPAAFPADQSAKTSPPAKTGQNQQDQKTLITVTYDVGDIVAKLSARAGGSKSAAIEDVAGTIVDLIRPEKFLGKKAAYTIQLVNQKTLGIRASRDAHREIADLLAAIRRVHDGAVVVKCNLYEVDRKLYDEQIAGKLHRRPGSPAIFAAPATDDFERQILDGKVKDEKLFSAGLQPLKSSETTIQNGAEVEFFSWRATVPYKSRPAVERQPSPGIELGPVSRVLVRDYESLSPQPVISLACPGFSFAMRPVVSADARKTQIKLTQKVARIAAWKKEKKLVWRWVRNAHAQYPDSMEVYLDVPILEEATFASNFAALDDWPIVAAVQSQRPDVQASDKILVLVFSARIRIEEEEQQILQGKKQLTEADAIRLAERFIVQNGYTDLPAMKDKTKLSHESIDFSDPDERLKLRFNSLERKAYGLGKVDLRKDGWTIVFRYNANNNRSGRNDYHQYVKTVGRALTMKADGSDIRMMHQDFYLKDVKVIRSGDK
jgi:hypothetical protein